MTKRFGFTLAEVLITLGIIGVVAAMTIPTLISNTNGAQFKTGFKKALSTLNQAAIMNVAMEDYDFSSVAKSTDLDGQGAARTMGYILTNRVQVSNGPKENYSFPGTAMNWYVDYECTATDVTNNVEGCTAQGTEITKTITKTPAATDWAVYGFSDGTSFGFPIAAENCTSRGQENCIGFIDVNGGATANPNQVTVCTDGEEGGSGDTKCTVSAAGVKDVFPVFFYGQVVEPASDAAREVLFGK